MDKQDTKQPTVKTHLTTQEGIQEGIYTSDQLSNENYHLDTAIGSSVIKAFYEECPLHCYRMYFSPDRDKYKKESKKSYEVGTNAHFLLLEPEKFEQFYVISPDTYFDAKGKVKDINKNSGFWKGLKEEVEFQGKTLITNKDLELAKNMANGIRENKKVNRYFSNGAAECSFFAKDPETGLMLKARPDYLTETNANLYMLDYKSTGISLNTLKQNRVAMDQKREIQASHHKNVVELALTKAKNKKIEIHEVLYITGSQNAPYIVDDPTAMPGVAIGGGDIMCKAMLQQIKKCMDTNHWPNYTEWGCILEGREYKFIKDYEYNEYQFSKWEAIQQRFLEQEQQFDDLTY